MEHNAYHTIFWGIEVKITDILLWGINFAVLSFLLMSLTLCSCVDWIRTRRRNKVISIGQLAHLSKHSICTCLTPVPSGHISQQALYLEKF